MMMTCIECVADGDDVHGINAWLHATPSTPGSDALPGQLHLQDGVRLASGAGGREGAATLAGIWVARRMRQEGGWAGRCGGGRRSSDTCTPVPVCSSSCAAAAGCGGLTRLAQTMVMTFNPSRACPGDGQQSSDAGNRALAAQAEACGDVCCCCGSCRHADACARSEQRHTTFRGWPTHATASCGPTLTCVHRPCTLYMPLPSACREAAASLNQVPSHSVRRWRHA